MTLEEKILIGSSSSLVYAVISYLKQIKHYKKRIEEGEYSEEDLKIVARFCDDALINLQEKLSVYIFLNEFSTTYEPPPIFELHSDLRNHS